MARPREFDENAVLDAAAHQFWIYGYVGTSVRDLARSMGIAGASLYNAFGDKRSLFQRALTRYVEKSFGDWVLRLERNMPPLDAIKAFFRETVERSVCDRDHKGCLLVNSALEVAPHDAGFRAMIANVLAEVVAFLGVVCALISGLARFRPHSLLMILPACC